MVFLHSEGIKKILYTALQGQRTPRRWANDHTSARPMNSGGDPRATCLSDVTSWLVCSSLDSMRDYVASQSLRLRHCGIDRRLLYSRDISRVTQSPDVFPSRTVSGF